MKDKRRSERREREREKERKREREKEREKERKKFIQLECFKTFARESGVCSIKLFTAVIN